MSVIHHVCGNHEWAGGRCEHSEELDDKEPEGGKKYLDPESPAVEALRAIVFDTRWLKSLDYYIRSRHTGQLEVYTYTSRLFSLDVFCSISLCTSSFLLISHYNMYICSNKFLVFFYIHNNYFFVLTGFT